LAVLGWMPLQRLLLVASAEATVNAPVHTLRVRCAIGTSSSLTILTRTRSRSADADRNLGWLRHLPRPPLVDILICTYNEDEEILERTIIGGQALEYGNFRLWVCDDGQRCWLRTLCERLNCGYLTRADNAHAKAGNINSALRHLGTLPQRPEFIAILDADFVVQPKFLQRALEPACPVNELTEFGCSRA
jgi:cellulose synthase (UDP-forming)